MKRILPVFILLFVLMSGCGKAPGGTEGTSVSGGGEAPLYARSTTRLQPGEGYNPYMMEFTEKGMF